MLSMWGTRDDERLKALLSSPLSLFLLMMLASVVVMDLKQLACGHQTGEAHVL